MSVYPPGLVVRRAARISEDGRYRYTLVRRWGPEPPLQFVMLNPSTADAEVDDRTIGRCVGFARDLGAGGILVVNLYAYRATKPVDLWRAEDPVGPDADLYLRAAARRSAIEGAATIAAWGVNAKPDRVAHVLDLFANAGGRLHALGLTKDGHPRHPLYLPATARPVPFGGA